MGKCFVDTLGFCCCNTTSGHRHRVVRDPALLYPGWKFLVENCCLFMFLLVYAMFTHSQCTQKPNLCRFQWDIWPVEKGHCYNLIGMNIISSTKKIMVSPIPICLLVCCLQDFTKNYWTHFHDENWMEGGSQPRTDPIDHWYVSRWRNGSWTSFSLSLHCIYTWLVSLSESVHIQDLVIMVKHFWVVRLVMQGYRVWYQIRLAWIKGDCWAAVFYQLGWSSDFVLL